MVVLVVVTTLCAVAVVSGGQTQKPPRGGIWFDNATKLAENVHQNNVLYEDYMRNYNNRHSGSIDNSVDNVSDEVLVGGMPTCYQYCSEWCWATVSTMMIAHYTGERSCDNRECAIVTREWDHKCCPSSHACKHSPKPPSDSDPCNKPGTAGKMIDAINHWARKKCQDHGPLSLSGLEKAAKSAPVGILVLWKDSHGRSAGGGHAVIVASHPKKKGYFQLHDPWDWSPTTGNTWKTLSYDQILRYHNDDSGVYGQWVESVSCPGSAENDDDFAGGNVTEVVV
jgi:hypothetical protein